jgi:hypothetical protein
LAGLLAFQKVNAKPTFEDISGPQVIQGRHNEFAVIRAIWPVLIQSGKVGRIYYAAPCPSDANKPPYYPYPFPAINVSVPSKGVSGLAAIKEVFQSNRVIRM